MPTLNRNAIVSLVNTQPPQSNVELVERQCLTLIHEAHCSNMDTLVLAAAGYGKTSLLILYFEYLMSQNEQVAWLSLGEDDADPVHLLAGICTTIQALGSHVGSASLALISAGSGVPYRVILTTLMIYIMQSPRTIKTYCWSCWKTALVTFGL
jgi:ATP/maltotriose-dependent transcriptional regulator MalT